MAEQEKAQQEGSATGQPAGGGLLVALSSELSGVVERAGRSVVRVNARRRLPASGIVWSADGAVVTADHVLEIEEGITVGLPDGREVPARIVGRDPGTDIAVLRVQAAGLDAAEAVEPASVRIGNLVLALGRPGAGPMAAIGVVSARTGPWRTWRGGLLESLIQSDVTLFPGFSGGPLVDAVGRVVGMNTSLLARGMSTTVPAETVQRVAQSLLTQGRVRRGYLGVSTQPVAVPSGLAQKLGLAQDAGLLVVGVEQGSPADRAGLILGDVLIALAGHPVRGADDLQGLLGPGSVGVTVQAKVIRGGELRELSVTPGERP